MLKPTPKSRVLFARRYGLPLLVLFGVFSLLLISFRQPQLAQAATTNTLNFQARLQTAAGAIVSDGYYNVEFKLYSASSGGTALWTEDYLNSASQGLQTVNGYLSANLGSISAFPSTIDWSQQLWLTMNIGGTSTGSVTWDGEMNPRLPLTAVPYAFQAKSADQLQVTQGSYSGTLGFGTLTDNRNISLPDENGVVCLQTSIQCGFLTSAVANGQYIQNSVSTQSANINVQAASSGSVAAKFQANASGSGDILDLLNGAGVTVSSVSSNGDVIFKPSDTSLTAFQVQDSTKAILDVDTINGRVGIDRTNPAYALDVNGDINSNTAVRVGGVSVCTVSNCVPAGGSDNYIQNGTSTQTNANFNIRSVAANAVTGVLQGASGQTADILQVESWDGTSTSLLMSVGYDGTLTVNGGIQANDGINIATGSTFVNGSSTLNTPLALSDFATGGAIGTAAATVDTHTAFTINQATAGQTISLPNPTNTTAGRIVYISNIGSVAFTIGTISIGSGTNASFLWNGTTWAATAVSTGVSLVGNLDAGTANANGAYISGNYIYLQSASSGYAGVVNTGTQTFNGAKTFSSAATFSSSINTNTFTGTALTFGGAGAATIQAATNQDLDLISNGTGALNIGAVGTSASSSAIHIADTSSGTGTQAISIGSNANAANSVSIEAGNAGQIQIGNTDVTHTIKIGAGAVNTAQSVFIGSADSSSLLKLQAGTGNVVITGAVATTYTIGSTTGTGQIKIGQSTASNTISIGDAATTTTQTINIGTSATGAGQEAITIGSTNGASSLLLQGGTGNLNLNSSGNIVLGTGSNTVIFTAGGGLVASGTAQHLKSITLPAEYAGAVLDAQSDSSCSSSYNGTMTSGFDGTNYINYYQWVSSGTAQCYDVVVRVPVPTDFGSWAATALHIYSYTSNTSTGLINVDVRDTSNASVCSYASNTPSATNTWQPLSPCALSSGTFTPGGTMTLRIRMTGNNGNTVRIGQITLSYNSKF